MATNKVQTAVRLEPELLYKIAVVAKKNSRSMNGQIEHLVQQCVKQYEEENGQIPIDPDAVYR